MDAYWQFMEQPYRRANGTKRTFKELVAHALAFHGGQALDGATTDDGNWTGTPLFEFTRLIKGWFKEGMTASDAWAHVMTEVDRFGGWEYVAQEYGYHSLDEDDAEEWFTATWTKVRMRPGVHLLSVALEQADAAALAFNHTVTDAEGNKVSAGTPRYKRFLRLAAWLQYNAGDRPILLPIEKISKLIGCKNSRTIGVYRDRAIAQGWIAKVADHDWKRNLATQFRYLNTTWVKEFYERENGK